MDMNISKSINAKLTLTIAGISLAVITAIMLIEGYGVRSMMYQQILRSAEAEADLAYMSLERPMIVGDNTCIPKKHR